MGITVHRPRDGGDHGHGRGLSGRSGGGVWNDLKEIERNWQTDRIFTPAMDEDQRLRLITRWHKAVDPPGRGSRRPEPRMRRQRT